MRTFLITTLLALMPAVALAQTAEVTVAFTAPDGRAYETKLDKAKGAAGFKLDKLGTTEKHVAGRPFSVERTKDWFWAHAPGGGECKMDYLIFQVKTDGQQQIAQLVGAHKDCKEKVAQQGTVLSCTDPSRAVVQWAGTPEADALKACDVPAEQAAKVE